MFQSRVDSLNEDLKQITEEKDNRANDKAGLTLTVKRYEELALRVMKPWVNPLPGNDEMTKVLMLN